MWPLLFMSSRLCALEGAGSDGRRASCAVWGNQAQQPQPLWLRTHRWVRGFRVCGTRKPFCLLACIVLTITSFYIGHNANLYAEEWEITFGIDGNGQIMTLNSSEVVKRLLRFIILECGSQKRKQTIVVKRAEHITQAVRYKKSKNIPLAVHFTFRPQRPSRICGYLE